ncbi:MAG: sensor domain-containing diguanylate cyclase [Gammaproteobacteria bacterium]|nr:sensor domain-containing diguanylate cyclase [Gammaproteobacteria bacterium]
MQEPLISADEAIRIKTLRELNLLDTPCEDHFDRLARITQHLFGVPMVLISLIDSDRQWLKSAIGVDIRETPRSVSFCGHTILEKEILVVNDTRLDHRFADNPLVINAPHIRFYAGRPICATNGKALGTLCVIDRQPRHLDPSEARLMNNLAELVEKEINLPDLKTLNDRLMRSEQELIESLTQLRSVERHERARNKSLELMSRGYPLHEVLYSIVFEIEQHSRHAIACIELANPVDGEGSRFWANRKSENGQAGVWLCRSEAITSSNGELLGRLTTVRPDPGKVRHSDRRLIEESATLASIAVERDLTDRMIWKQANYDSLTGLPNRNLLRERLGREINKARRHNLQLGLMFIDLDHLKQVNDTLGHHKGDELLAQVGARLKTGMRDSDTVARLGGDEFTVVVVELDQISDVEQVAEKVLSELAGAFRLGQESVYLSASIGIAFYPDHGEDMESLIKSADQAMYDAKNSGRNRFVIANDS